MSDGRIALVTGATGAIGPLLVGHLIEQGYRVRTLVRGTPPPGLLPDGIEAVRGTIDDAAAVRRAVEHVDAVFHLAAKLHIADPSPELRDEYRRVNVEGTCRLVESAQAAGVRRLVFFSTINVYGSSRQGQLLTEDSPLLPDSWYAETKAEAEGLVLAGVPAVVLRLAAVYGPRMKGNYPRLVRALQRGRFVMVGDGRNRRTLVYVEDVCAAAVLAAQHPAAAGRVYNLTDGRVHTVREVIAAICAALGRRPPRLHLPLAPVRVATGLLEDGFRLAGRRAPIGRRAIEKLVEDAAVSGARLQQELGFRPRYDLATGWREAVRSMHQGGHAQARARA